ncbi:SPOR domain-containing protein [Pseudoalteromonas sp. CST5]|uniref:SPOR domain-containing protein n=1 Tax=unclassified Pseudoalteromonas TaxID=194690 RepID=UPI0023587BB3|nr:MULTISPECIES: SPOR domain-containing protein [unclassified Pseudoalteromonas]MDC9512493.1 SPOR domain-containing protein [Pseudoalteromonas sp. CST1]MDC9537118.1 SPOR domain-containing protein [Pseudoalteromonas sp. CST3]MDC9540302.1 SPOR domain-containing protein [Pseudoalteromonas sp. CST2]MDC9544045.1 SPOR domain-containing protein [Pseudoalteromonas sp. CST4]MDC9547547.1 SPOR domain-containing protein [Pseudoalteromonas sp. CST5]
MAVKIALTLTQINNILMLHYKDFLATLVLGFALANSAYALATAQKQAVLIKKDDLAVLKESAQQWQQTKPQLERLLKLESELQRTVDKLKQLNAQPKPQQTNHLAVVNTNALFAVQVGAYKNKAVLEAAIKQFQSASNKLEVNTEQVLIDQHTFYRLKLGAFKTKEAAKDACKSLINNNTCFVTYYVKTPQS